MSDYTRIFKQPGTVVKTGKDLISKSKRINQSLGITPPNNFDNTTQDQVYAAVKAYISAFGIPENVAIYLADAFVESNTDLIKVILYGK